MKKNILNLTVLALVTAAFAAQAVAGPSATQTVSFEVAPITEIHASGSPSLVINSATGAGGTLVNATASGTYAITTNQHGRKITAKLDNDMPNNVTLTLTMAAPLGGGTAMGSPVTLSQVETDMVTAVVPVSESGLSLNYELSADETAGVVAPQNRTVTFTITESA